MIQINDFNNGHTIQLVFANGLNLSILQHDFSYSDKDKTVEIAILKDGEFVTQDILTDLNDEVKGWVNADDLADIITKVKEV